MLSRAWHATRRDLLNARHARQYAESGGGKKRKPKKKKNPKGKPAKRTTDEYMVRPDDNDVGREAEALMRPEEEDEEERPDEAAIGHQVEDFGIDEEAMPETGSSAAAARREPARRCKGSKSSR